MKSSKVFSSKTLKVLFNYLSSLIYIDISNDIFYFHNPFDYNLIIQSNYGSCMIYIKILQKVVCNLKERIFTVIF